MFQHYISCVTLFRRCVKNKKQKNKNSTIKSGLQNISAVAKETETINLCTKKTGKEKYTVELRTVTIT